MSCRNPTENMSLGFPACERGLVVTQWPVTRAAAYKQAVWSTGGAQWRLRGATIGPWLLGW